MNSTVLPSHQATAAKRGLLGSVVPNSRAHWTLMVLGLAGSFAFDATWFIAGLVRTGYDPLVQPISALSLGPGGWVQMANFVVFGTIGIVTAFAWRPTLAGGLGATWYPRISVLAGAALICAAIFSQDPGHGFPVGALTPAHPSWHAQIHNIVSYISLIATIAQLLILARRMHREARWHGWAPAAVLAAVLMMTFLAIFGVLVANGGPAGLFEKLASTAPALFGFAFAARLIISRDLRFSLPGR